MKASHTVVNKMKVLILGKNSVGRTGMLPNGALLL